MKQAGAEGLTEAVIKKHVDERSFRLGKSYAEGDSVFHCPKEGDLLKARCYGNSEDYYVLSARLKGSP